MGWLDHQGHDPTDGRRGGLGGSGGDLRRPIHEGPNPSRATSSLREIRFLPTHAPQRGDVRHDASDRACRGRPRRPGRGGQPSRPGRDHVFAGLFDVSGARLAAHLHSCEARPWLWGFSRMRRRWLPPTWPRVVAPASTAHPGLDLPPRQRLDSSTRWHARQRLDSRPNYRTRQDLTIRR